MGGTKTGAQKAWKTRRKKYGPSGYKGEHHMKQPKHRQRMRDNNPAKRPEIALKIIRALTGRTRAKSHCQNISKALKGKPNLKIRGDNNPNKRPDVRAKNAKTHKEIWANMTEEERRLRFKAMGKRPNTKEKRIDKIVSPLGFEINAIECRMIGGRRPDFIHNHEQRIIEYDGYKGHNPAMPWTPDTWEECLALDDKRDQSYHDAGYKVLRIFPEDLAEGDDFVREKVGLWMLMPWRGRRRKVNNVRGHV